MCVRVCVHVSDMELVSWLWLSGQCVDPGYRVWLNGCLCQYK